MRWKVWLVAAAVLAASSMLPAKGAGKTEWGTASCYPPRTVYTQIQAYGDRTHWIGSLQRFYDRPRLQLSTTQFATGYLEATYFMQSAGTMVHSQTYGSCQF